MKNQRGYIDSETMKYTLFTLLVLSMIISFSIGMYERFSKETPAIDEPLIIKSCHKFNNKKRCLTKTHKIIVPDSIVVGDTIRLFVEVE